jgi:xylose dehydrogenase (NAD/NADP)
VRKAGALNVTELKEMLEACRSNQVTFMEAFMYQFHPQHKKVKELIGAGKIGDVSSMRASFSYFLGDPMINIRMNQELGGGSLYDVGCYALHSIRNILDSEPIKVFASAKTDSEYGIDTTTAGVLTFENGVQALFDCSFESFRRHTYEIFGSTGKIEVMAAYRPDTANEKGEGLIRLTKGDGEVEEYRIAGDQYKLQAEHFADSILNSKEPSYTREKMMNNMKILDACYESIVSGVSVEIK